MYPIDRRSALRRIAALGLAPFTLASLGALAEAVKEINALKPGEFTWHPGRSPKGPVAVIVLIPEQLTHVYRTLHPDRRSGKDFVIMDSA